MEKYGGKKLALPTYQNKLVNIHSLIGLAVAPDFTKELIWNTLSDQKKEEVIINKEFSLSEDLEISYQFIKDGENNLVLKSPIEFEGSVYLYHGMMDTEVPHKLSEKVLKKITKSNDVKLILEKYGEHRLSKDKEIETIKSLLKQISNY